MIAVKMYLSQWCDLIGKEIGKSQQVGDAIMRLRQMDATLRTSTG